MRRRMMKSKIHRATVTDANLDYVGSISIAPDLLAAADIMIGEQVQIVDINNGARFETYAIEGGPGQVCLNGAAARLVQPGDRIIIITYADYEQAELPDYAATVARRSAQQDHRGRAGGGTGGRSGAPLLIGPRPAPATGASRRGPGRSTSCARRPAPAR